MTLAAGRDELRARFSALHSTSSVASLLEVSHKKLVWHIWKRPQSQRYARFRVKKRRGGFREIAAPTGGLKLLQLRLKQVLDAVYDPRNSVHGFLHDRGILSNSASHVGRQWILNVDLEDFFPSITFPRVRGMLMRWPYNLPAEAATALAQVCFAGANGLPQGAPTSPVISNMLCAHMDKELGALAAKFGLTYTRYSDDITFSPRRKRHLPESLAHSAGGEASIGPALAEILHKHGFRANTSKVRLRTAQERQEVTGLIVNQKVNIPRRFVRQLRAALHACEQTSVEEAEKEFRVRYDMKHRPRGREASLVDVLNGRLAFLSMVRGRQDSLVREMVHRAREIDPRLGRTMILDDAALVIERDIVEVMKDDKESQGSGFILQGIGFVTASHVVTAAGMALHSGLQVRRWDDRRRCLVPTIVLNSPEHDIAVFNLPRNRLPSFPAGNSESVRVGDSLTLIGFPNWAPGDPPRRVKVNVTGKSTRLDSPRLTVDLGIQPGMSGGVALNSDGKAVGVMVTGNADGSSTHPFGVVPINTVLRLHRQNQAAESQTIPDPAT